MAPLTVSLGIGAVKMLRLNSGLLPLMSMTSILTSLTHSHSATPTSWIWNHRVCFETFSLSSGKEIFNTPHEVLGISTTQAEQLLGIFIHVCHFNFAHEVTRSHIFRSFQVVHSGALSLWSRISMVTLASVTKVPPEVTTFNLNMDWVFQANLENSKVICEVLHHHWCCLAPSTTSKTSAPRIPRLGLILRKKRSADFRLDP